MSAEANHELSEAVRAYLHWRKSLGPQADVEAVRALAGTPEEAEALVIAVERVVAESEQIPFTDEQFQQYGAGVAFRALLAERCPELDDEALRGLASRIAYNRFR